MKKFSHKIREAENFWIPLSDGVRLAGRSWQPVTASKKPVSAVLDYNPQGLRHGTVQRDDVMGRFLSGNGLAFLRVDVRGTGESEGVAWDDYAKDEQDDALEVIAWVARQPWCSGFVGMMGKGWGGFNALQVAARRPPALKAIITVNGSDDRYEDDVHYQGGTLLTANLRHAAELLSQSTLPPDREIVGDKWRKQWHERLTAASFQLGHWLRHPHRDSYWRHGSVCETSAAIDVPVLLVGGWEDVNVNAIPRLMKSLRVVRKAIIGPWGNDYPHLAPSALAIGFLQESLRWWRQWLRGEDTGIIQEPDFRYFIAEPSSPEDPYAPQSGRWLGEGTWGASSVDVKKWYLTATGISGVPGMETAQTISSPTLITKESLALCYSRSDLEEFVEMADEAAHALVFDTPPLKAALQVTGQPLLEFEFAVDQPLAQVAIALLEVWPGGELTHLSSHIQNLCQRDTREAPSSLVPGRRYRIKIKLAEMARMVPAGHRLRVRVATTSFPLAWPAPAPVTLTFFAGPAVFHIPLHKKIEEGKPVIWEVEDVFGVGLRPVATYEVSLSETGESQATVVEDWKSCGVDKASSANGCVVRTCYRIKPEDPLSAVVESQITQTRGSPTEPLRTEVSCHMNATPSHWWVKASLKAYDGSVLVFSTEFAENVERRLV